QQQSITALNAGARQGGGADRFDRIVIKRCVSGDADRRRSPPKIGRPRLRAPDDECKKRKRCGDKKPQRFSCDQSCACETRLHAPDLPAFIKSDRPQPGTIRSNNITGNQATNAPPRLDRRKSDGLGDWPQTGVIMATNKKEIVQG